MKTSCRIVLLALGTQGDISAGEDSGKNFSALRVIENARKEDSCCELNTALRGAYAVHLSRYKLASVWYGLDVASSNMHRSRFTQVSVRPCRLILPRKSSP